jgi:hypothetical protein
MQVADHDFRIDQILGATEGDETDFEHGETWTDGGEE